MTTVCIFLLREGEEADGGRDDGSRSYPEKLRFPDAAKIYTQAADDRERTTLVHGC